MSTLHFIRHGKATPGGPIYDQLHPVGETQARLLGEHLQRQRTSFDAVYTGPLVRQRETWRLMRAAAAEVGSAWPDAVVLEGLAEAPIEPLVRHCFSERLHTDIRLQEWAKQYGDGSDQAKVREVFNAVLTYVVELWASGELSLPEVESVVEFGARVRAAFDRIVTDAGEGREIAVITSNGVIGWLVSSVRGDAEPDRTGLLQRFVNTSISRVRCSSGQARIASCNEVPHLADATLHTFL